MNERISTSPHPSGMNRQQRSQAARSKRRELTAHARKSKSAKRMDRPEKLEGMSRGWQKIDSFLSRAGFSLA